jgi:N-acetylneuraminate synthase/N,N'-diacetyllegionaminate synthase
MREATGGNLQIIAEAGVNHNGDLERARRMVIAAAEAGADYVKFQAFRAEEICAAEATAAPYQQTNTGIASQFDLLRDLELPIEAFAVLAETCRSAGIGFLCTPFDVGFTEALLALGMDRIKVPSGEITNLPALRRFASFGLPVLLSTGMATLAEVETAVTALAEAGAGPVTLLHCTSLYPAPIETINLRAMVAMAEHLRLPVGYSDHSIGDHVAIAAVALGASVIEKHFTLDRSLPGPDHRASLEVPELAELVRKCRETVIALGDGRKQPVAAERETAALVRRSWHATRDLAAGDVISAADVTLKRPASGLAATVSPVGRRIVRPVAAGQPLRQQDLASP